MTTTGVSAAGLAAAAPARARGAGAKSSGGGSFADMITASLSAQGARQTGASAQTAPAGKTEQDKAAAQMTDTGKKPDAAQTAGNPDGTQKTETKAEETQDTGEMKVSEGTEAAETDEAAAADVSDADCEMAAKVLQDIRKAVSRALGLSMEELAGLIEQLGMTMVDLANVQQLTQLTLASANETDITVLLTDGDLSAKLHGLLEQVQGILDEAGMTPEKLGELIPEEEFAQLAERMPAMQTPEAETSAGRETEVQNAGREAVRETGEDSEPEPEESTFRFEAVRETRGGQVDARRDGPEQRDTRSGAGTQTQAEQFLNLVTNAAERTDAEVSFAGMDTASQLREIADQILERVRVIVSPARTSMEITLTPESLGKVNLNVVSQHGVMTARFTAQTEIARQAIESQLVTLRENLEKQGLKVDAIEVTVSEFGFSQSDQAAGGQPQEGRRQNRRGLVTEEAETVEGVQTPESVPAGIAESGGSRVDYTA